MEDLQKLRKEEKVCNDLLSLLPECVVLDLGQIEKLIETQATNFSGELRVMERFANWVKSECVVNKHYFNFFDILELVVKKHVSKKDYEGCISKMLLKLKRSYLAMKASIIPDKPLDQLNVTDDDLIPLELF